MPYTEIDHFIAKMRFRAAYPHLGAGSRVCDLGCGLEMAFLDFAEDKIACGVGIDDQVESGTHGRWQRIHADLRGRLPLNDAQFDHVVMLAVFEHLVEPDSVLREAFRILAPGGSLIMTWPAAMVDPILNVLHTFHLVSDEMESDEHQKRIPVGEVQRLLERVGFREFHHKKFELGLNNLMVAIR
ncbi:MAG TPA: class I SAM-dependent methyltransferase [Candidatus Acidoferrum sp.]|jgi:ubiquinone/menaquinone biosynthesis C-methylase UbiE